MANEESIKINQFKGMRDDENSKQIGNDYFAGISNFNYPVAGVLGVESCVLPKFYMTAGTVYDTNGIYELRYLDVNNSIQIQYIIVSGTTVRAFNYLASISNTIYTSTGDGKTLWTFATYNDKLFMSNGYDNIQVYYPTLHDAGTSTQYIGYGRGTSSSMGAPVAIKTAVAGNPNGIYKYAMTYVTAGGEEVVGSVSNQINTASLQVTLHFPIGYDGTLTRNIYRTKASGSTYYLLYSVSDNTTTTYTDNIADAALPATTIPATNNALPKPYQLTLCNQKLFGGVVDLYPTQVFATAINNEVIDAASFIDVANFGNDNTAVAGMGNDFNKVIVGTGKNILLIDPSDYTANTVVVTRAGVGIKNGYTVKYIPAFNDFAGGLMFVSTLNDVRMMSGLQALPVSTSLDNVSTGNWSQAIRGSLDTVIATASNLYAEYFNYQYHLLVDGKQYIYDIRTNGWTYQNIATTTSVSNPKVLAVLNISSQHNRIPFLFNGQYAQTTSSTAIEQEYGDTKYYHGSAETVSDAKDVQGYIQSGHVNVDTKFSFISKLKFWFLQDSKTVNGYRGDGFARISLSGGTPVTGNLTGNYKYLMTYIDADGNEVVGSYTNTVLTATNTLDVYFPNKLNSVTTWKIYRTKTGGSTYYYLTTGTGTSCQALLEETLDASLGAELGTTINTYTFSTNPTLNIIVTTDDNTQFNIDADFDINDLQYMDYKVVNINRPCRWFTYKLTKKTGFISFQGVEICGQILKNKE